MPNLKNGKNQKVPRVLLENIVSYYITLNFYTPFFFLLKEGPLKTSFAEGLPS